MPEPNGRWGAVEMLAPPLPKRLPTCVIISPPLKLSGLDLSGLGTSLEVRADNDFESVGLLGQDLANQLVYVESTEYATVLANKKNIAFVITTPKLAKLVPGGLGIALSEEPKRVFYLIHNYLARNTTFYGKSFETEVAPDARIHRTAYVADRNVRIGSRCDIGPNASILEGSVLEDDVVVRTGVVIGTEGFQFERFGQDIMPVIHSGGVLIRRGVELQANCSVSKAVFGGFTEIGEYSKFDNLVHVAHNCKIGKRCLVAANAMIAGSVTIGDDVWIGPSASISSEISIGDGASITIGSVVTKNVAVGSRVTGNFAIDHDKFISFIRGIS